MRHLLLLVAAVTACATLVACGGDDEPKTVTVTTPIATVQTPPPAAAATAAVKTHLAAAVDALRAGIQVPYEQGAFDKGGIDVVLTYASAAQAASTAVRELRAAMDVATSDGGFGALGDQAQSLLTHLTGLVGAAQDGNVDPDEIKGLLDDVDGLGKTAEAAGIELPRSSGVTSGTTTTTP